MRNRSRYSQQLVVRLNATANTSVALGARSEATGAGSVAIGGNGDGYKTTSNGLGATALGMQAKAEWYCCNCSRWCV